MMRILLCAATALLSATILFTEPEGFRSLFNGKDLRGWVNVNCAESTWSVKDGMIKCTGIPTGVLRTEKMYENFILEMEWKHVVEGGNAGLFAHSGALPVKGQPFTKAIEVQILARDDPNGNWTGHGDVFAIQGATFVPDRPHPAGWMRCLPSERRANPPGQWNHYRVECQDGRISLAVNGKVVSGGTKCTPRRGYICLESEGSEAWFRNLRIKELPSSKPPPADVSEPDRGFKSLYNGIDLDGWRRADGNAQHWQPQDWILQYHSDAPSPRRHLWSDREFRNYELIMDVRMPGNAPMKVLPILLRGEMTAGIELPTASVRDRDWNRYTLRVRGDRLDIDRNGEKVVKGKRIPSAFKASPLGLRAGDTSFEVANIYVRDL